ncbi:MAG: isoaspartyl peptidase/L-asparaginase family protein [Streptosporangiales bacterium]
MELVQVPATPCGYSLAVHGGAGARPQELDGAELRAYHAGLSDALGAGRSVLDAGGVALDTVCAAVAALEDNELFNAGRGAALTHEGTVELDAAVMTGAGSAGAVAGCSTTRNPVLAARAVMERTPHVLLIAPDVRQVESWGLCPAAPDYFRTDRRVRELLRVQERGARHGTVGAVARDRDGGIAAATSTGGMTGQLVGRVGDTPLIGAGTYAAGDAVAVSCTGEGEYFIRGVVAYDIAARVRYQAVKLEDAVRGTMAASLDALGGTGGLIAADPAGALVLAFNSNAMFRGYLAADGTPVTAV